MNDLRHFKETELFSPKLMQLFGITNLLVCIIWYAQVGQLRADTPTFRKTTHDNRIWEVKWSKKFRRDETRGKSVEF